MHEFRKGSTFTETFQNICCFGFCLSLKYFFRFFFKPEFFLCFFFSNWVPFYVFSQTGILFVFCIEPIPFFSFVSNPGSFMFFVSNRAPFCDLSQTGVFSCFVSSRAPFCVFFSNRNSFWFFSWIDPHFVICLKLGPFLCFVSNWVPFCVLFQTGDLFVFCHKPASFLSFGSHRCHLGICQSYKYFWCFIPNRNLFCVLYFTNDLLVFCLSQTFFFFSNQGPFGISGLKGIICIMSKTRRWLQILYFLPISRRNLMLCLLIVRILYFILNVWEIQFFSKIYTWFTFFLQAFLYCCLRITGNWCFVDKKQVLYVWSIISSINTFCV